MRLFLFVLFCYVACSNIAHSFTELKDPHSIMYVLMYLSGRLTLYYLEESPLDFLSLNLDNCLVSHPHPRLQGSLDYCVISLLIVSHCTINMSTVIVPQQREQIDRVHHSIIEVKVGEHMM